MKIMECEACASKNLILYVIRRVVTRVEQFLSCNCGGYEAAAVRSYDQVVLYSERYDLPDDGRVAMSWRSFSNSMGQIEVDTEDWDVRVICDDCAEYGGPWLNSDRKVVSDEVVEAEIKCLDCGSRVDMSLSNIFKMEGEKE